MKQTISIKTSGKAKGKPRPGKKKSTLKEHNKLLRVNALTQIESKICIEIKGVSVFHTFEKHMCCKVSITKYV